MNQRNLTLILSAFALAGLTLLPQAAPAAGKLAQIELDADSLQDLREKYGVMYDPRSLHVHEIDDETSKQLAIRQKLLVAERHMLAKEYEQALGHFERAAALDPQNQSVALGKLRALIELHRRKEALKLAEEIIKAEPTLTEACLLHGQLLEREQRYDAAEAAYRSGLKREPKNLNLLQALGKLGRNRADWDIAIEANERVIEIDGTHIFAYYLLAILYTQQADELRDANSAPGKKKRLELLEKAAKRLEVAISLRRSFPEFHLRLGAIYEKLRQPEKAHEVYERALVVAPDNKDFQKLFEVSLGLNRTAVQTVDAYAKLAADNPGNPRLQRLCAEKAMQYRQIPRAIKMFREMLAEDATDVAASINLAELQLEAGQRDEALETVKTALLLDAENVRLHELAARAYYEKQDYKNAASYFERLLKSRPKQRDNFLRLFRCLHQLKQNERAIEVLNEFAQRFGDGSLIHLLLGELYEGEGRAADAVEAFEKALSLNPRERGAYARLIKSYLDRNDRAKLEWLMDKGLKAFEKDPAALEEILGDGFAEARRYIEAADHYGKAVEHGAAEIPLFVRWIAACRYAGEKDKIEKVVEKIRERVSDETARNELIGNVYNDLEDYPRAERAYRQALDSLAAPQDDDDRRRRLALHRLIAVSLAKQKKTREVNKALESIGKEFSGDFGRDALWARCEVRAALEDWDASLAAAQEIVERFGEDDQLYWFMGSQYYEKKDFKQAETMFRKAIAINPNHVEAHNFMGYMWAERGERLDEAVKSIERALEIRPKAGHIIDSLGWAYYQKGDYAKAVELLEEAVVLAPPDPLMFEHLGAAHLKNGDAEKAVANWRKSLRLNPDNNQLKKRLKAIQK